MQSNQENKMDYNKVIEDRANQLCAELGTTDAAKVKLVYQTLKDTGLESWKNGKEAGFKRAVKSTPTA